MFFGRDELNKVSVGFRRRGAQAVVPKEIADNGYKLPDGRKYIAKLKPWHERIVDYMLCNPKARPRDAAQVFGVSYGWITSLMNTDAFREYYRMRMEQHRDRLDTNIVGRLSNIADKALQNIEARLEDPIEASTLSFGQLQDAAELSLKALGYTSAPATGVNVHVNQGNTTVVLTSKQALEEARQKMQQRLIEASEEDTHNPALFHRVTSALSLKKNDVEEAVVVPGTDDLE